MCMRSDLNGLFHEAPGLYPAVCAEYVAVKMAGIHHGNGAREVQNKMLFIITIGVVSALRYMIQQLLFEKTQIPSSQYCITSMSTWH